MPDVKPRVLLAARPDACAPFRAAVYGYAEVLEAPTMGAAIAKLKSASPIHLICSTLFFDESRMFDLLRWVKAELPHIPFICARALPKDMPKISLEAARIAADSLGAAAFIDIPMLAKEGGTDTLSERLRRLLLGHIKG
ncbi:MAG TPA: hypothetical protein VHN19_02410 [Burkholderiales bacterium]|jgi:hypothetical protein|nr:hypothetical protein [Burkholderiales bacterium]HEX2648770.1 hypothetical protein [Burkholderiales bacterium]